MTWVGRSLDLDDAETKVEAKWLAAAESRLMERPSTAGRSMKHSLTSPSFRSGKGQRRSG